MRATPLRRLLIASAVLPAVGCVTTNQFKDFLRTEIAAVATQVLTDPLNQSLSDLTGPQVVEEIVPSI